MIKKFTIYGERCSGTNWLENIITMNFNIEITWKYGWKHFPGFDNLENSDDTLFICISRNPVDWLNSFYLNPFHLPKCLKGNVHNFLNDEFWSFDDNEKKTDETKELLIDRNLYSKERYKNIFELRHIKLKYMIEDLPKKVKNYIFIRYEDLVNDFENTINKIKDVGLVLKGTTIKNTTEYKKEKKDFIKKNYSEIPSELILNNPNFNKYYESKLGYIT